MARFFSSPKEAIEESRWGMAVSKGILRDNGVGHMAMMVIVARKRGGYLDYSWAYLGNARMAPPCRERVKSSDVEAVRKWYAY